MTRRFRVSYLLLCLFGAQKASCTLLPLSSIGRLPSQTILIRFAVYAFVTTKHFYWKNNARLIKPTIPWSDRSLNVVCPACSMLSSKRPKIGDAHFVSHVRTPCGMPKADLAHLLHQDQAFLMPCRSNTTHHVSYIPMAFFWPPRSLVADLMPALYLRLPRPCPVERLAVLDT